MPGPQLRDHGAALGQLTKNLQVPIERSLCRANLNHTDRCECGLQACHQHARLVLTLPWIVTKNIWVSTGAHIINDWLLFLVTLVGACLVGKG
jgi:hypothetical protein